MSSEGKSEVAKRLSEIFPLESRDSPIPAVGLRPLTRDDLPALVSMLENDPDMTWTRNRWGESNIEYLLNLRLEHYEQYEFGVYGVEDLTTNQLIGMAGLQFWDEGSDDIEAIAYVDKVRWNGGVATAILREMVAQVLSDERGVPRVLAATRHDNLAAQAVARSLGMQQTGEGDHYGAPSIFWQVDR